MTWWDWANPRLEVLQAAATLLAVAAAAWWFVRRRLGVPRANLRQSVEIHRLDERSLAVWVSLTVENIGQVEFRIDRMQCFYQAIKPLAVALEDRIRASPHGVFDEVFLDDPDNRWRSLAKASIKPKENRILPGESDSFAAILLLDDSPPGENHAGYVVSQVERCGGDLCWRTRTFVDLDTAGGEEDDAGTA